MLNILFNKSFKNRFVLRIKNFIFNINDKFPILGKPLVTGWSVVSNLKFIIWKKALERKIHLQYGYSKLDLNRVCWVNPEKIQYSLDGGFNKWHNFFKVLDGNWDKHLEKFENLDVYQAFQQRFEQNKKWEDTEFYHRVLKNISDGSIKWGCHDKKDFDKRVKNIDALYYEIKNNGIKTKEEIFVAKKLLDKLEKSTVILDNILIAIGRDGNFLFVDGRHRLSIAKLLKLPQVPVNIVVRHKEWMDFRKELITFMENYGKGKFYQPFTHPDLANIPFFHGDTRFKIIKENLSSQFGTVCDIGANFGYFSHKFEDEGFDCYAVEGSRMHVYFLEKLKKAENKKFKIIHQSIFEYQKNQELKFDVILALNIFHHFLKDKGSYFNMIKLLRRMKAKELFFEPDKQKKHPDRALYKNYSPEEFVNFIIENSCFKKAKFLGNAEDSRPIYKLT
jgi:SAM-dependent methyltransferase